MKCAWADCPNFVEDQRDLFCWSCNLEYWFSRDPKWIPLEVPVAPEPVFVDRCPWGYYVAAVLVIPVAILWLMWVTR